MEKDYHAEDKAYFPVEYGNITEEELHEFPSEAFKEDGREIQAGKSKSIDSIVVCQK